MKPLGHPVIKAPSKLVFLPGLREVVKKSDDAWVAPLIPTWVHAALDDLERDLASHRLPLFGQIDAPIPPQAASPAARLLVHIFFR